MAMVCFGWIMILLDLTLAQQSIQRCSIGSGLEGKVIQVSDGTNQRCVAVVANPNAQKPLPVLFWFHGSGGNAGECGAAMNQGLGQLAIANDFALVCAEARQFSNPQKSGLWRIPEVITDATGTPCQDSDSIEYPYIRNVISALNGTISGLPKFDTNRVFTSGCSMGSAFSGYVAQCIKQSHPDIISAFATHSTGLKVKGDGNTFPPDEYNSQYTWGECPQCKYFPFQPKAFTDTLGLKACVFDNTADPSANDPFFYKSSQALAKQWQDLGMKAETHFESGGHCQIHSFEEIVDCLDDGSKRLLAGGPVPTPGPSPSPRPGPSPSPDVPPASCQTCFKNRCPNSHRGASAACKKCVQANRNACAPKCMPYPFFKAISWFCGGGVAVEDSLVV